MAMQHDRYWNLVGFLAMEGVSFGLNAERLLGLEESEVGSFCIGFTGCDHRVLQDMHDCIAGYFRFLEYRWPLLADLDEPADVIPVWEEFAMKEFRELMMETAFARGFFNALRFSNTKTGYAGEAAMRIVQRQRYRCMFAHPPLSALARDNQVAFG
ncbi:MAG: hypothetical protein JST61_00140 [Acidobacteria bacterium]|nr:hypothetical protein [Acidobacteriota bacterium]